MTIGIDLRVLSKGTRSGIEEYTINLLSRLLSLDKNIQFKLFYNAFNQVALDYDWLNLPNVELKKFHWPNRFVFDPTAKFLRLPKILLKHYLIKKLRQSLVIRLILLQLIHFKMYSLPLLELQVELIV